MLFIAALASRVVAGDVGAASFLYRFVFVVSDGEQGDDESVRRLVSRLADDGVLVVGLGLGQETLQLRKLIPISKVNLTANELPAALATLLMQSLRGR